MRPALASIFALIVLAGCGGSGSADSTRGLTAPTVTTSYVTNLMNSRGQNIGQMNITLNPDSSFSVVSSYGPGFSGSGTVFIPSASTTASLTGTITFNADGSFQGQGVTGGQTYELGGSFSEPTQSSINGNFQFLGSTIAYASTGFSGAVSP